MKNEVRLLVWVIFIAVLIIAIFTVLSPSESDIKNELALHDDIRDSMLDSKPTDDTTHKEGSKIVYGDLRFGMSQKEYDKIIKETFNTIGNESYVFRPSFNDNGELYLLSISSVSKTANYIDTELMESADNLFRVIKNKYGPPDEISEIHFFSFNPGFILWKYTWNLYTKKIQIGIAENESGATYRMVAWIYDVNMKEDVAKAKNGASELKYKKDSEKF